MKRTFSHLLFFGLMITLLVSCGNYTPKPHGYPRFEFPERGYKQTKLNCPYELTIPSYAKMIKDDHPDAHECWYNLSFVPFDATMHLTYKQFESQDELDILTEDSYQLAMKHTIKALEIQEKERYDTSTGNFIMVYDFSGNTATPYNFYVTDGEKHFLRGSFYFDNSTDKDSVRPVYEFIKEDLDKMVENVRWEE